VRQLLEILQQSGHPVKRSAKVIPWPKGGTKRSHDRQGPSLRS
jgi:hypothetical protein